MDRPTSSIEFGWGAPPIRDQCSVLSKAQADQFERDNAAILRLHLRGLITDSQMNAASVKLAKKIERAIRAAPRTGD